MNPTLELIRKRRSIRRYDPNPLTQDEKDSILKATMRAPTGCNMMFYSIIEVNEPAKKARLAETCNHQPFIAKAPYILLFLADYQRWVDLYDAADCEGLANQLGISPRLPEEGEIFLALMDALIAAQTAVIAAEIDRGWLLLYRQCHGELGNPPGNVRSTKIYDTRRAGLLRQAGEGFTRSPDKSFRPALHRPPGQIQTLQPR